MTCEALAVFDLVFFLHALVGLVLIHQAFVVIAVIQLVYRTICLLVNPDHSQQPDEPHNPRQAAHSGTNTRTPAGSDEARRGLSIVQNQLVVADYFVPDKSHIRKHCNRGQQIQEEIKT